MLLGAIKNYERHLNAYVTPAFIECVYFYAPKCRAVSELLLNECNKQWVALKRILFEVIWCKKKEYLKLYIKGNDKLRTR